jgi:hypothetical protein
MDDDRAVTGSFHVDERGCCEPIAKGHDNRSTATSFNLGLVSCKKPVVRFP